jgi:ABC-2 type transport system permease protein
MDIAVAEQGQPSATQAAPAPAPAEVATPAPGSIARFFGNTWAITKKELSLYFSTPLAYVILGVFIFAMGYFFYSLIYVYQEASLRMQQFEQMQPGILDRLNFTDVIFVPLFRNAAILYVIMIPFLTMRLIAEEKRQSTFQLMMTAPVRPWELVFGKFISVQLVLSASLALTVTYPLLLNAIAASGGVEWQTAVTVYLGYFLMTAAYASLGLFVSSLTESPIVAALVTLFAVLLPLHVLSFAGASAEGVKKDIIDYVCSSTHLQGFMDGTIRLSDVAYFASVTILGLVLTRTAIERARW